MLSGLAVISIGWVLCVNAAAETAYGTVGLGGTNVVPAGNREQSGAVVATKEDELVWTPEKGYHQLPPNENTVEGRGGGECYGEIEERLRETMVRGKTLEQAVNKPDEHGYTPFDYASMNGVTLCVQALLQNAELNPPSKVSPLTFAAAMNHRPGKLNTRVIDGNTCY
jgi:hypothetical protein